MWRVVGVRGRGFGWLHNEGAREEGGYRGARGEVSAILSNGDGLLLSIGDSDLSSSESMSGGSGSSKNVGRSLGMYFSPMNVKAPEPLMNSERAGMPLGVPRSSGRASSRYSFLSFVRWASYRSHALMMYSHVYSSSPHSQSTFFSGKNCFRNSPMYA